MKRSKEAILGCFSILLLCSTLWVYNYFVKKKKVFSKDIVITAEFDRVNYLSIKSPVMLEGYLIGAISKIYRSGDKIAVEMLINKESKIPKNAWAEIVDASILGGRMLYIHFDKPCSGSDCIEKKGTIEGKVKGLKENVDNTLGPAFDKLKKTVHEIEQKGGLDSLLYKGELSLKSLNTTLDDYEKQLANLRRSLPKQLASLNQQTSHLSQKDIQAMIDSLNLFLQNEALNPIEITTTAKNTMRDVQQKVVGGNQAIDSVELQVDKLTLQLASINAQDTGMISKLLYEKQLRDNSQNKIVDLKQKFEDIREHPEKYKNLRKKK